MTKHFFPLIALLVFLLVFSHTALFAQTSDGVHVLLDPPTVSGDPGDSFDIDIVVIPKNQPFYAIDTVLNYNPAILEVVDSINDSPGIQIQPSNVLSISLANRVNNVDGQIIFGAGEILSYDSNESFVLATITFKIKPEATGSTSIDFELETLPNSTVSFTDGDEVFASFTGTGVSITEPAPEVQPIVNPEYKYVPPPVPETPVSETPSSSETQSTPSSVTEPSSTQAMPESPSVETTPASSSTTEPSDKPAYPPAAPEAPSIISSSVENKEPTSSTLEQSTPVATSGTTETTEKSDTFPVWAWVIIGVVVVGIIVVVIMKTLTRNNVAR